MYGTPAAAIFSRRLVTNSSAALVAGLWNGIRLGWIPVVAFIVFTRGRLRWLAVGAIPCGLVVNPMLADDLSRSIMADLQTALRKKTDMDEVRLDLAKGKKLTGDRAGALAAVRDVLRWAPAQWVE